MKQFISAILLSTGLILSNSNVFSFERPDFDEVDTNNDGKISTQEFLDGSPFFIPAGKIFNKLDKNKDSFLVKEEFNSAEQHSP